MNKNKIYMYIGLFILLVSTVGSIGTYAYFTWSSTNNTSVTLSIGELADVTYITGPDIKVDNLSPVYNYTDGVYTTFNITNRDTTSNLLYTVKLNITSIDTELQDKTFKYVLLENDKIVSQDNFENTQNNTTLSLYTGVLDKATLSKSAISTYKLYFYIDGNEENDPNMMNKSLIGKIDVSVEENQKIEISSDNSTLSIDKINNAKSYNIYSNDELLANTTDNNLEIYKYYTLPGTYNVKVNAVMNDNTEVQVGKPINYTIKQLNDSKYLGMFNEYTTSNNTITLSEIITSSHDSDFVLDKNIKNIHICEAIVDVSSCQLLGGGGFKTLDSPYCDSSLKEPNNCYDGPLEDLSLIFNSTGTAKIEYDKEQKDIVFTAEGSDMFFTAYFMAPGYINSNSFVGRYMLRCLSADTEITVYDKKKKKRRKKKIKDITYDDLILVWDFDKGCYAYAKPLWIKRKQLAGSYNLIKFSDGSILKTISNHRIFNKEKGKFTYPMSDETPIGTTTFNAKGEYVKVVSKEVINEEIEFCNIITDYHINLFANNILTSCRLSNIYKIKDMKYVKDNRKLNTKEELNVSDKWYYGLRLSEQDKNINKDNDVYMGETINDYINNLEDLDIRE